MRAKCSDSKQTSFWWLSLRFTAEQKENIKVEEVQVDHQEKDAGVVEKDRHLKHPDVNQKSPSEVWNAFLQMARFVNGDESEKQNINGMLRLTRESDILSEKQKKEESKTATYTAVEKTLNGISNEMGLAVTPRIDQSTLIQQNCRKTITENNETVNGLCKEVAQVFVADITNVVDKQVQAALQSIRNEADYLSKELRKRNYPSAGVGSRWEGQPQARGTWSQDFDKGVYRTKKRRVYTPSPYPRRSASKEGQSMSSDIMRELEAKIERQAQALINLAQENEKVRYLQVLTDSADLNLTASGSKPLPTCSLTTSPSTRETIERSEI